MYLNLYFSIELYFLRLILVELGLVISNYLEIRDTFLHFSTAPSIVRIYTDSSAVLHYFNVFVSYGHVTSFDGVIRHVTLVIHLYHLFSIFFDDKPKVFCLFFNCYHFRFDIIISRRKNFVLLILIVL